MWYKTGTINLTTNNATVTGIGTAWADAKFGVMPGMILLAPDNKLYEVKQVNSNTSLTLNSNYAGSTANGQSYAIITTYEGDISQFSARFAAMLTFFQGSRNDTVSWFTGSGDMTFTKDDGIKLTVPTLAKIQADYVSKTAVVDQQVTGSVLFNRPVRLSSGTAATDYIPPSQGSWVTWNRKSGTGNTDFINHRGSGVGGFTFWDTNATTINKLLTVSADGSLLQQVNSGASAIMHRYIDSDAVERAATYASPNNGAFTIRWAGTKFYAKYDADGTVVFPSTVFSGSSALLKTGDYGLGATTQNNSDGMDLDTVNLPVGFYAGNNFVASIKGLPPGIPTTGTNHAYLMVENLATSYGNATFQRYVSHGTANFGTWVRNKTSGIWSDWYRIWDSKSLVNPMQVGDAGVGAYTPVTVAAPDGVGANQFFRFGTNTANAPTVGPWAGVMGGYDGASRFQMAWAMGGAAVDLRTRVRSSTGGHSAWQSIWHTGNTTVDANGFLKKASPIARLTSNPEKMTDEFLDGFTLSGLAAVNGEAAGVTAERVSVGVYKVTGSLGFALEGWNIEVPQDVNGNRLCFVATESAEDGTITVKVSKRRFDIDTAAIVAGEPMDIPEGRWIDLRLEMPPVEEVQSEPEPESNDGEMTGE